MDSASKDKDCILFFMSRTYFKADVEYDSNCGPVEKETWYIKECNTTDYRTIVREDGKPVSLEGTDSFFNAVALVAQLQDSGPGITEVVKVEEVNFFTLPRPVKEVFDLRWCQEHPED